MDAVDAAAGDAVAEEAEEIYKNLEVDELIEKSFRDREIVKLTANDQAVWKTAGSNKNEAQ